VIKHLFLGHIGCQRHQAAAWAEPQGHSLILAVTPALLD
jgi:hypothetical protein